MFLKILVFPDQRLRTVASKVENVDSKIESFCEDLLKTMYKSKGIGLAATQVDFHKRIIVIDISEEKDSPLVLINPTITILSPDSLMDYEEGCLSVPGFFESVHRPDSIEVKALNEKGEVIKFQADGLLALVIQHEYDHLDGKVFVDYLSSLKRQRIRKQLLKQKRERLK